MNQIKITLLNILNKNKIINEYSKYNMIKIKFNYYDSKYIYT